MVSIRDHDFALQHLAHRMLRHTIIDVRTRCWVWVGTRYKNGYGQVSFTGFHEYAHRVSWQMYRGPIPTGKHVLHLCDNRPCWNPDHLWVGTNLENHQDAARKGRQIRGTRHPWAKLTEALVAAIRADRKTGMMLKDIALKHGLPYKTVEKVVYRVSWKHLP